MTDCITLRGYVPIDLAACIRIWRAATEEALPFLSSAELDVEQEAISEALRGSIDVTIALVEEAPVGFIALSEDEIAGLFVDPRRQGSGIGAALVRTAIQAGRAGSVDVYARNKRARGFYEHMGYREASRRSVDDLGRPFELVRMARLEGASVPQASHRLILRPARESDISAIAKVLRGEQSGTGECRLRGRLAPFPSAPATRR